MGPGSTVANLDAMNLPAFAPVANVENSAGTDGSREFSHDPHSPAPLDLLVNYMASFTADGHGYGETTPMVDPTTVTTTHSLTLTNPHT